MGAPIVIFNDTTVDRHHGCRRVMRTLRACAAQHGFDIVAEAPAHRDWRADDKLWRALEDARLVIVNGEGSLHHGSAQAESLLSVATIARDLGIPSALINTSWSDNPTSFVELAAAFSIVATRESRSQTELKRQGVSASRTIDLSLYYPFVGAEQVRQGFLFTDSVAPDIAHALARACMRLNAHEVSLFEPGTHAAPMRRLRTAMGLALRQPTSAALLGVLDACSSRAMTCATDVSFMSVLSSARALVSGRFHALCFSLLTKTPFLAVASNTHKIEGVLHDAGCHAFRMANAATLDGRAVEDAAQFDGHEEESIDDYLAEGRAATRALFGEMAALC
jgi:polysaccharide pyruvyl transferase WcaK-like protein